jgi:RecB family exonuclease
VFGRTPTRRRAAVASLGSIGTGPDLHVVGSRYAAHRARTSEPHPGRFGPDLWSWSALLERLWACAGDGRAVFTAGARRLAAIGIPGDPATLARREHELDTHLQAPDSDEREAVYALRARLDARVDHVRPAVAWRRLLRMIAVPPPALGSLLGSHPFVWIDGLRWVSPLEAQLAVALLRAWSAAGAHAVLTLQTGRDRGGAEVVALLGGESTHPSLRATAGLRAAVIDGLVATGEAEVVFAGVAGPLPIEPWSEPGPTGPTTLADTLLDGEPADTPTDPRIRVWQCPDADTEARLVAAAVRTCLERGAAPSDCVVAAASGRARIAAALRDAGVPSRVVPGPSLLAEPVASAWLAVAPAEGEITPDVWRQVLLDRAVEVRGTHAGPDRSRAWAACVDALDRLALDLRAVSDEAWPATALADALRDAFERRRLDHAHPGVDVVDPESLAGGAAIHTFVCGLARGAWPRAHTRSSATDPRVDATEILSSVLAEAFDDPQRTVTLSWASAPSALLRTLGLAAEMPAEIPARGRTAGLRAAAADPAWDDVLSDADRAAVQLARADDTARRGPLGPHDGHVDRPPALPEALAVTALETYVRCPARYWYSRVLRLEPTIDASAELDPRRRGIAVHRILERMHRAGGLRPLSADDETTLRRRLHDLALTVLDDIEAEGGFEPAFQAWARARLLAGLLDDRPAGLLRVWLDAERASDLPLVPVAVEQPFHGIRIGSTTLRGVLDRVDRLPDGTRLVVDYKTGSAPSRAAVEDGLALQPLVYTAAVAAEGHPVASVFLSLPRADAVRWTGWAGDPEALDRLCPPSQRRNAVVLDADTRARGLERLAAEADALARGVFPPTRHPPEVAGCPSCPYRTICRVDPARHSPSTLPPESSRP